MIVVVIVLVMAAFPSLFTSADPTRLRAEPPASPARAAAAIFGYDFQGCDVFAQAVYGARNSVLVGVLRRAARRRRSACCSA